MKRLLLLFCLGFNSLAGNALTGVVDDNDQFVRIHGYSVSYDTATITYSYSGNPEFVIIDGMSFESIIGGTVNLSARIASDGTLLDGEFEVTGGIPSLGIANDSLLFSGAAIKSELSYFGAPGDTEIINNEFLIKVDSTLLPTFDSGYIAMETLFWAKGYGTDPDLDLTNTFTFDWGPRDAPTFNHFQQAIYKVSEPGVLLLLLTGLLLISAGFRRNQFTLIHHRIR